MNEMDKFLADYKSRLAKVNILFDEKLFPVKNFGWWLLLYSNTEDLANFLQTEFSQKLDEIRNNAKQRK